MVAAVVKEYSGELISQCIKCGDYAANTEHRACDVGEEHLRRTCCNCGYTWREQCLDVKEPITSNTRVEVFMDEVLVSIWHRPAGYTGTYRIYILSPSK